jgi:hypothetical protein
MVRYNPICTTAIKRLGCFTKNLTESVRTQPNWLKILNFTRHQMEILIIIYPNILILSPDHKFTKPTYVTFVLHFIPYDLLVVGFNSRLTALICPPSCWHNGSFKIPSLIIVIFVGRVTCKRMFEIFVLIFCYSFSYSCYCWLLYFL